MNESLLGTMGYTTAQIEARLHTVWHTIFEGSDRFYFEDDEGLGYVMDTGNDDVRTEGMSYAMMLAVQYNRKDVFDKLWGWVMRHMHMEKGYHAHYFAWSVAPDGTPNSSGPAPDGEEYFAMALFLASRRWGDGKGLFAYSARGREILRYCVHKGEAERGEDFSGDPMWNPDNKLIKFIPEVEWSDPSYHLPHCYEVFAEESDAEDRNFWREAAAASRNYLKAACDPDTGMSPEYANFDGSPHVDERDHWHFYSDAYRTVANIGLDAAWYGPEPTLVDRAAALQAFFLTHDRTCVYDIDGTAVDERVLHPVGFIATMAQGSLAAICADRDARPDAERNSRVWVDMFWNTPMRVGARRYYDNFLYAFAMLALAGEYRKEWR